ncbi:MAG: pyridoxal phosphate-dependent aminotransferase [Halobacteriales archaeon]
MPADRLHHIPFSGIREVFEECDRLEARGEDIVHLEIGRPDFDTPAPIKEAAVEALDAGHVHYTSNWGIAPLREAIADKFATENDVRYDHTDEVIVTTGATEAVLVTVLAQVDAGDEVLVPDPCWTYEPSIRMAGAEPVFYRLDPADGFQPDLDSLSANVSADTALMIVNTPHNPTGAMLTPDRAAALRDFAVSNDLLVLSDEIYEQIRFDREHVSLASLDGMFDRTVTVNGFSKAYSMTGWRLGYLAAPASLAAEIVRIRQFTTTCAPSFAQHAGVRALSGDLSAPMVEAFGNRRDRVVERVADVPGMTCPDPAGAFYAFPTAPDVADDGESFVWSLLREQGVALVPGSVFSPVHDDRVRIAFSNSTERIDEAFDRIEAWVAERS